MKIIPTPIVPKSSRIFAITALAVTTILLASCVSSQAADINWRGGTADYNLGVNWVGGVVPGPGDDAINDNGTNNVVQINSADPDWTVLDIRAGNGGGSGAFRQYGRTVTLNGWFRLGVAGGDTGIYTLSGGTLNYQGGEFNIGELGTGILHVGGGFITGSGNLAVNLGAAVDGSGTLNSNVCICTQTNGMISITGQFFVGNRGPGVYHLSGGSLVVANWIAIGRSSGSGTMTMSGGTVNQTSAGQNFLVGSGYQNNGTPATGVLNQSGGAINCQGQFLCPESSPSTGTYNLSGTGALTVNNWIAIGRNGATGTLNMSGGAITKTGDNTTHFDIGAGGVGMVTQTGGAITNTVSDTWIGESTNATWDLNGGSAVLRKVILGVKSGASGTLNLNGGIMTATEITAGSGANEVLNLNGGTLRAGAGTVNLIHGLARASIGASGATLDSAGQTITLSQNLLDNGGGTLTKLGRGTITLTGVNTYRGNNMISAGQLITGTFSTGGGSFTVADGAGMGVVVESANGQINAPTVTLGSSSSSSIDFDLGPFGNPTLAPLNVTTLKVEGVVTLNILSNSVMQVGEFPLIKYATLGGAGSFAVGELPWGTQAHVVTNAANQSIDLVVSTAPLSGVISANFDGQNATGWAPPDANAAVGPNQIVCWGNNSLTILNKNGGVVSSQDASAFFGFTTSGDGHVIYDEISKRFALEVLSTNDSVGFAVSDTSDPRGPWHKINIGVPGLWDGYGGNGIGYNADAYVIHINGFNNRYAVIAASNNVNLAYSLITAPSNVRIGQPVPMTTAVAGGPFYFVQGNDDGVNGQGGTLGVIEVVKVSNILSGSPSYTDYQVAATSGEASVINVSWRNHLLGVIGKVGSPAMVKWYLLNTSSGVTLAQSGTITPGDNGAVDAPSIAVAPDGSLAVNYTAANNSGVTAMYVAGRLATDPAGAMRAPRQIISGPTTDGRWGDYSSCVVDINSAGVPQNSFWACNEYLTSPGMFNWKDRLANFSIPTASSLAVAGSLYVDLRASDLVAGTTTWTNRAGTGNFVSDGTDLPTLGNYQGIWAVQLDGAACYKGPYTTASLLSGNAPRTIEAWVNNPSVSDEETPVALGQRGTTDHNFAFNYGSDVTWGALAMWNDDIGWKTVPTANTWHYLAVTFDGTNLLVYRDGLLDNSALRTAATPVDPIWIGNQNNGSGGPSSQWFSGYVNSVRLYTGVLSRSQIAANYALGPDLMPALPAPTGLTATANNTQINLSWNGSAGAAGYNIHRSLTNGGPYTVIATSGTTNYPDATVVNGSTYYYVLSATNIAGESPNSLQASASMPLVNLAGAMPTNGQFTLHFQAANNDSLIVEVSTNLVDWTPLTTNTPTGGVFRFTDTNATVPVQFYRAREN